MARHDADAAQLQCRSARKNIYPRSGRLKETGAFLQQPPKARRPDFFRLWRTIGLPGPRKPHALGATDRGVTGVGGVEALVDRFRSFRIG